MLKNIIEKVTSRLVIVLLLAAVTASTSALSYIFNGYTDSMEVATKAITTLSVKVDVMSEAIQGARESRFNIGILFLLKQSYKLDKTPKDVKPMDITAASDFCGSALFYDFKHELKGSEKIKVMRSCDRMDFIVSEKSA